MKAQTQGKIPQRQWVANSIRSSMRILSFGNQQGKFTLCSVPVSDIVLVMRLREVFAWMVDNSTI
jgi:hypothetical protein